MENGNILQSDHNTNEGWLWDSRDVEPKARMMQVGSEPEARREISVVEGIAAFDRFRCDGGEYSEDFVKITLFNDEYSFAAYVRILGHLEVQVVLQAKYIKKASLHPANVTQEGWADTESEIPWILHGNLQVNATKGERPFILSPQLGTHIETFDLKTEDDIRFIVTIYDAHQDLDHILQPSLAMRTNFSNFHRESDLDVYFQLDEGDELEDPKNLVKLIKRIDFKSPSIQSTYLGLRFMLPALMAKMHVYEGFEGEIFQRKLRVLTPQNETDAALGDQTADADMESSQLPCPIVAVAPRGLDRTTLAIAIDFLNCQDITEKMLYKEYPAVTSNLTDMRLSTMTLYWMPIYLQCQKLGIFETLPGLQSAIASFAEHTFNPMEALKLLKYVVDPDYAANSMFLTFYDKITQTIRNGWDDIKRAPEFRAYIRIMSDNEFNWIMNCISFDPKSSTANFSL